ncbi:hypothetical protein TNCT_680641 [Trichonephila clavata]|uniref:Uncharacterized protein n=1 Tax=Trichonephila clavata TaxID=2740835 RepID=A0A8X6HGX7_TRICU|nr:hypothetical protein TNCT_680641 [Trichonephila clavata]
MGSRHSRDSTRVPEHLSRCLQNEVEDLYMIPQRRFCPQQALILFIVDLWVPPPLERTPPLDSLDSPPMAPLLRSSLPMPFPLLNTGPVLCSPRDFFPENE